MRAPLFWNTSEVREWMKLFPPYFRLNGDLFVVLTPWSIATLPLSIKSNQHIPSFGKTQGWNQFDRWAFIYHFNISLPLVQTFLCSVGSIKLTNCIGMTCEGELKLFARQKRQKIRPMGLGTSLDRHIKNFSRNFDRIIGIFVNSMERFPFGCHKYSLQKHFWQTKSLWNCMFGAENAHQEGLCAISRIGAGLFLGFFPGLFGWVSANIVNACYFLNRPGKKIWKKLLTNVHWENTKISTKITISASKFVRIVLVTTRKYAENHFEEEVHSL